MGARRIGTPAPTTTSCSGGRHVGRIWRSIYKGAAWQDYPWHWKINVPDEADIDWGHSMTLVEAMQDFRRAWDAHVYKTEMKRVRD